MKRCSTCKVEKPFEEFSKDKLKKDGFDNQCKYCRKQYREENKDKFKQYHEENKDKISKQQKQYYEENKDKLCEQQKQYYEENKDKIKQYREENKDKISEQKKQYREENKDKISEYSKQYRKENKGKILSWKAKRRAQKLQATPTWLTTEHLKSIERFYTISKEMELISGVKYHVDHIIPLQGKDVCGLHVPWNLQVIEASENLSKNNKLLDQDQEFYHQILEFDDLMENIL